MDQRFLVEALGRRPALFKAMVEFNRAQQDRSDDCALLASLGEVGKALMRDPAVRRACSGDKHGNTRGWWDFSEESCRLVLLSDDELRRLALMFSAAVYGEEMALVLNKAQVIELRSLLGDAVFSYAIRRGRYQIGSLRPFLIENMPEGSLTERLRLLSAAVLFAVSRSWPEELRPVWAAKLQRAALVGTPPSDGEAASAQTALPPLRAEQRRVLWFTLKKLLLREAAPQWAPCFD